MTRKPELPLDERGQIPGQLSIDEVTEDMPEGPRKASDVEATTKLTAEQAKRQKTSREVQGRIARRKALKRSGADVATSNPDLAAKLEDGLQRADQASYRKFRTDKAMQNLVRDRLKDRKS
jgi:hypothetical protein